jgi:hypothetical protein
VAALQEATSINRKKGGPKYKQNRVVLAAFIIPYYSIGGPI